MWGCLGWFCFLCFCIAIGAAHPAILVAMLSIWGLAFMLYMVNKMMTGIGNLDLSGGVKKDDDD